MLVSPREIGLCLLPSRPLFSARRAHEPPASSGHIRNPPVSDTLSPNAAASSANAPAPPPLFYTQPEPLLAGAHKDFKIRPEKDFSFAARTNTIPLTAPEFALASRHFPILLLGPDLIPV